MRSFLSKYDLKFRNYVNYKNAMSKRKAASTSDNPNHDICELLTGNEYKREKK